MDASDTPLTIGLAWPMRQHEARLLADSLRTSRLTLLYASTGESRQKLLSESVMALLGRRESDAPVTGGFLESRVVAPFVDRREPGTPGSGIGEQAVYFSSWDGDPLSALVRCVRTAFDAEGDAAAETPLVDALASASDRLGGRCFLLLDGVEALWSGRVEPVAVDRFVEGLTEVVNRRGLRTNVLLSIDDRWESRMDVLRRRIPGFDDSIVRLVGLEIPTQAASIIVETSAPPPESAPAVSPSADLPNPPTLSNVVVVAPSPPADRPRRKRLPKTPRAPVPPIRTEGVYALIESTLTQTADSSEPWHDLAAVPAPSSDPIPRRASPRDESQSRGRNRPSAAAGPEPPSPIDEWLDRALAWCRRIWHSR